MLHKRALLATVIAVVVVGVVRLQVLLGKVARDEAEATVQVVQLPPSPTTSSPQSGGSSGPQMPYLYPVHTRLPKQQFLHEGVEAQAARDPRTCASGNASPLPDAPEHLRRYTPPGVDGAKLLHGFGVREEDTVAARGGLFFQQQEGEGEGSPWWVPSSGNIPCTSEAQLALQRLQNPASCKGSLFLKTRLKEKAHGLGSSLSLVVHDLITSVATKRLLVVESTNWAFAPPECSSNGWTCYFAPPSRCPLPPDKPQQLKRNTAAAVVFKKDIDAKGFSRNDLPPLSSLLSTGCVKEVESWAMRAENTYLMGTFQRGGDPLLIWWMAQALRYLMRAPQPWFSDVVRFNLRTMGYPWRHPVVFEQLRGEIAKFREYYNVFGCHDVALPAYGYWTGRLLRNGGGGAVYISGNTPRHSYSALLELHNRSADHGLILSTWNHPASAASAESSRWGASSLVVSWTDFWAGVAATGWVCIVQSNWCRMINFLRLTAGRADCPFIDLGLTMMSHPDHRSSYCVVKSEWPTKPFSSVLKKYSPG